MTPRVQSPDRRRVQRSALMVGLWVGVSSAAVLATVTAVIVAVSAITARPAHGPRPGDGRRPPGRIVDLDAVIALAVLLGVVGVVALGCIAWWIARRTALPLATALQAQRDFVADAGHELRTPLTTLTSRIQVAQHRLTRGGDTAGALEALRHDAAVLDAVLTDLLLAAESAGTPSTGATGVLMAARDAAMTIDSNASAAGVRVVLEVDPALVVATEHTALARALVALLDNAVRHAGVRGTVTVRAVAHGRVAEIRVADTGGGITGVDPERVFDRFVRSAREGDRRGFGLGLALVRDVATRFGGAVRIETTSPSGTAFLLTLPIVADS